MELKLTRGIHRAWCVVWVCACLAGCGRSPFSVADVGFEEQDASHQGGDAWWVWDAEQATDVGGEPAVLDSAVSDAAAFDVREDTRREQDTAPAPFDVLEDTASEDVAEDTSEASDTLVDVLEDADTQDDVEDTLDAAEVDAPPDAPWPVCATAPPDPRCLDGQGTVGTWALLGPFPHEGCGARLGAFWDPGAVGEVGEAAPDGEVWEAYEPLWRADSGWSICEEFDSCSDGSSSADLNCHYSGNRRSRGAPDFLMAFAQTHLVVARDVEVELIFSGDDNYRVWLNGQVLMEDEDNCSCYGEPHATAVMTLEQGVHRVLIALGEQRGAWGFLFRVRATDGSELGDVIHARLR